MLLHIPPLTEHLTLDARQTTRSRRPLLLYWPFLSLVVADFPIPNDQFRHNSDAPSPIGPFENIGPLGCIRTKSFWVWADADTAKIEPVGIPASLNGDVGGDLAIRVTNTSGVEQIEIGIGKIKHISSMFQSQVCPSLAVAIINAFIHTPGIVEDGKELDDFDVGLGFFGKTKPVFQDPRPMSDTMDTRPGQSVFV
jgi:hypothetical protein